MNFLQDFKERKLVQWGVAYLATAWLLTQLVDVLGTRWGVSTAAARVIDMVLVIGFFVALVIAWYHGEKGEQRIRGTEVLLIGLIVGIGGVGISMVDVSDDAVISGSEAQKAAVLQQSEIDSAPWIAVLPFEVPDSNALLAEFAEALSADVTSGMSRYSHLLVLSRSTVQDVASGSRDVRVIGEATGARFVMEGSMRQGGHTLRATVRLVRADDGATVWTQRYERQFSEAELFALQDDLTARIVATVGDVTGVVMRELAVRIRGKAPEAMTPYEAMLMWSQNRQSASAESHRRSRIALERAVELEPGYADAWAALGHVYMEEYISAYNTQPEPMDRALVAVQRALELDRDSALAHYVLSAVQYFRQDLGAFRAAMARAVELNPYETQVLAFLGILLGYGGDWVHSVELTTRAMDLNPDHPGWYYFNTFFNQYHRGNYAEALEIAQRINMPGYWGDGLARTLAHGKLGNAEAAAAAAADLLAVWPGFEQEYGEMGLKNWMFASPGLAHHIMEGLRNAGLDMQWDSSWSGTREPLSPGQFDLPI